MKSYSESEWYEQNYNRISVTAKQNSFANKIMHKLIELPFKTNSNIDILEVGANRGEHIIYVKSDFLSYTMTDIREESINPHDLNEIKKKLWERRGGHLMNEPLGGGVTFLAADVQELPFKSESFDRVISTCLFHHLGDPLKGFQELRRVTRKDQTISILIPNDPGMMYRFLRRVTLLRNARKLGLLDEARYVHALAHPNNFPHLSVILHNVFSEDTIIQKNYPFFFSSYDLNIFTVFHITKKN
jgi:ubiquinone/menaquinone biosynthesis C-methylase UbiE